MTGLRPRRSPAGPDARAPTITPTFDMTNALANAAGVTFQACDSDGAAIPIELMS